MTHNHPKTVWNCHKCFPKLCRCEDRNEAPNVEALCATCNGSGWVTRDPDIGTDRECSVCDGKGRVSDIERVMDEVQREI